MKYVHQFRVVVGMHGQLSCDGLFILIMMAYLGGQVVMGYLIDSDGPGYNYIGWASCDGLFDNDGPGSRLFDNDGL